MNSADMKIELNQHQWLGMACDFTNEAKFLAAQLRNTSKRDPRKKLKLQISSLEFFRRRAIGRSLQP